MSHQLVEVIFFNSVRNYIDAHKLNLPKSTIKEIEKGFTENIGFKRALKQWPKLLTNDPLDRSREPMTSQERLRPLRNESIHWPAGNSVKNLAHSAYFTGIEASKQIYSHFSDWKASEYSNFIEKYPSTVKTYPMNEIQQN